MTTSDNNRDEAFRDGAAVGLAGGVAVVCAAAGYLALTGLPPMLVALVFGAGGVLVFLLLRTLAPVLGRLLSRIPPRVYHLALAALGTMVVLSSHRFRFGWGPTLFFPVVSVFLVAHAVLAGAVWALWRGADRRRLWGGLVVSVLLVDVAGMMWLRGDGSDPYRIEYAPGGRSLAAPNPAEPGRYEVEALTYGAGTDVRRPEFGEDVDLETEPVDASKILPDWTGFKARARRWYWGIEIDEAPLNGRVWAPVGDGPFPLVLVVHGNHGMEDHSDAGYAYLGELLASRGFITVSVDENYINGTWSGDFRGREMSMRAWLLLEHLRVWHAWNETAGHRFEGSVDVENIALMGHSRGGEAVSVAHAFNELSHFPNDATVRFDYGFEIKSLVAIAQTDRHYPRRVRLENVNFLTLQGSYDSDEASSFGMRQFRRIRLDAEPYRFKAGVYVHGANHGQFNSTWGMDSGPPFSWLLNRAPLISSTDQEAIAKTYIAAFLEATLNGDERYVPLFRDPRAGVSWLPDGVVRLGQFEDATFQPVANFDEDLDVTTGTRAGTRIDADGFAVWREEELRFRDDLTQGTNGVVLGVKGDGVYAVELSEPAGEDASSLTFFLASSTETVPDAEADDEERVELSVELEDTTGATTNVAASDILPMVPPLRIRYFKLDSLNERMFPKAWEPTFQSYDVPLERFTGVDTSRLRAIRFRVSGQGVVILDDIGLRR